MLPGRALGRVAGDRGARPRALWSIGGLAGEILDWLEGRGGEASVAAIARALRRPVWDALHRLATVGAVALGVEPPDTAGGTATERVVAHRTASRPP